MKTILTAILFFLTCSVSAQEPSSSGSQTSYKITEESEPIEAGKMTFVKLKGLLVESSDAPGSPIELTVMFAFITKDNKPSVWPIVTLSFMSRASKSRFPTYNPNLIFLLDGKQIEIRGAEAAERGGDIATSFTEPGVEWLDISVSQKTFNELAYAKRVEMRIGQLRLHFRNNHMEALRELAKRMVSLKAQHNN